MTTRQQTDSTHPAAARQGESGFMLVFVILLVSLILIVLAVSAPIMARQLRRDKELETQHRAEQYVRAIRLYYRKFKTYPPSIEALEKTNDIRFLRKQYIDPLTGKSDWRLIHVGENQTTVKGFFGKPLSGINATGAGGGLGSAASLGTGFGGKASPTGGSSTTIGATTGVAAGFQGATIGGASGTSTAGAFGTTPGSTGTGTSSTSSSSSGLGSTTGVGQIIGVGTAKTGNSILNPNEQTTYETWEFIYDPRIELLYQRSGMFGGQPSSQSASGFGSDAATGQSNSGASNPTMNPTTTPTNSPNSPFSNSPK